MHVGKEHSDYERAKDVAVNQSLFVIRRVRKETVKMDSYTTI